MTSVLALTGGVGGAKLALGLARVLPPGELTCVVNTGDDFRHLGLDISPDIDTLLYTLAGLADPVHGWGRRDDTATFMQALTALGGTTWFHLGDADLAMHVERTHRQAAGHSLAAITDDLRRRLGIAQRVVPMCNEPVRTRVRTAEGWLAFQEYFVRRRCEPAVRELEYLGADAATPVRELQALATQPGLRAVVICPSNPFLSVGPVLALRGVRDALARCTAPVIAVSPIVAGRAVKGPTAKLMGELGFEVGHAAIAAHYDGLIDALLVDDDSRGAAGGAAAPGQAPWITAPTLMQTLEDRERLARCVLDIADRLAAAPRP